MQKGADRVCFCAVGCLAGCLVGYGLGRYCNTGVAGSIANVQDNENATYLVAGGIVGGGLGYLLSGRYSNIGNGSSNEIDTNKARKALDLICALDAMQQNIAGEGKP